MSRSGSSGDRVPGRSSTDSDPRLAASLRELRELHRDHRSRRSSAYNENEPARPVQQRWRPSRDQLGLLEGFYLRENPPSQERIKEITEIICEYGPVDQSKVYYWFQNRRSRDKRKRRREEEEAGTSNSGRAAMVQMQQQNFPSLEDRGADMVNYNNLAQMQQQNFPSASGAMWAGSEVHRFSTDSSDEAFPKIMNTEGEGSKVMLNGKCFQHVFGTVHVKSVFGENSFLLDSCGEVVPSDRRGMATLLPGRAYNLVYGDSSEHLPNISNDFRLEDLTPWQDKP